MTHVQRVGKGHVDRLLTALRRVENVQDISQIPFFYIE